MVLQSRIPPDGTPAQRLKEYLSLARELSLTRDAHELTKLLRARLRFIVPATHGLSLSRRGLTGQQVRVTRSTRWQEDINPWKEPQRLPVLEGGLAWRLMEAGQAVKIDHLEVPEDDPFSPYAQGMKSLIAAPVFHDGQPVYMTVLMHEQPEAYTLDDLSRLALTANLMGRTTSQIILHEELQQTYAALDREFRTVGEIQRQLLPRHLPRIPDVTVAVYYETSRRAGGDYYDFFEQPDGTWGLIIADVSGHGPAAAVVMAMMHAFLKGPRQACPGPATSPLDYLRLLNTQLMDAVYAGQFVTALLGFYDPRSRTLRYANAGHNPPRWLRAGSDAVTSLGGPSGLPLAIVEPYEAGQHTVQFARGDRLLLYTDGITETLNPHGAMFGTQGLDAALHCCSRTPSGLIETIVQAVTRFADGAVPEDDRTLVALAFD